uniref:SOSS complex subunit A homolog n=1 Tax=Romanomermis culicivorax TaxID=13658 RepID=A0A915KV05_ROMCU
MEKFAPAALIFCLNYLFKTSWHCRKEFRYTSNNVNAFGIFLENFCTKLKNVTGKNAVSIVNRKIFGFLKDNLQYCKEFLLYCTQSDVRNDFSNFLSNILTQSFKFDCSESRDVAKFLLELINEEARVQYQNSSHLFAVFKGISEDRSSVVGAKFLLENGIFSSIMGFLLINPQPKTPEMIDIDTPKKSPPTLINGDQSPEVVSPVSSMVGLRNYSRRFSSNQARDFKAIYSLLADLIIRCKFDDFTIERSELGDHIKHEITEEKENLNLVIEPPADLSNFVKNADLFHDFVKEILWAYRHVEGCSTSIEDMLLYLAWSNNDFCRIIVFEILLVCQIVPFREFKSVSPLLCRMLISEQDANFQKRLLFLPLNRQKAQTTLVKSFLDGVYRQTCDGPFDIKGLLYAIKSNHQNDDGRRAYACVKLLSNASNKCLLVKNALNQRQDDWLWAVQWLREKMTEVGAGGGCKIEETGTRKSLRLRGAGGSTSTTIGAPSTSRQLFTSCRKPNTTLLPANVSNDDISSTSFRRTVSAQITLDEAEALLSEMTTARGTLSVATPTSPFPPPLSSPINVPEASNFVVVEVGPQISSKTTTKREQEVVNYSSSNGTGKKNDGNEKSPTVDKSTQKSSQAKFF